MFSLATYDRRASAGDATGARAGSALLPPYVSALEAVVDRAVRFCTVMKNGARTELRAMLHVGSARGVPKHARGGACSACVFEDSEFDCVDNGRRQDGSRKHGSAQRYVSDHARALQASAIESSRHRHHRTIMQSASVEEELSARAGRVGRHLDCPERASAPSIRWGSSLSPAASPDWARFRRLPAGAKS